MSRAATIPMLLVSLAALAACEGGYKEVTSPCVDAETPRLAFRAGPEPGAPAATRRADPGCAFTAVGGP